MDSQTINILHYSINIIPPRYSFESIIDLTLIKFPKNQTNLTTFRQNFLSLIKKYINYSHLYTDGSKSTQYKSSTVIYNNTQMTATLPSHFTTLFAKLYAIVSHLSHHRHITQRLYLIISDSLSVHLSIKNHRSKHQEIIKSSSSFQANLIIIY